MFRKRIKSNRWLVKLFSKDVKRKNKNDTASHMECIAHPSYLQNMHRHHIACNKIHLHTSYNEQQRADIETYTRYDTIRYNATQHDATIHNTQTKADLFSCVIVAMFSFRFVLWGFFVVIMLGVLLFVYEYLCVFELRINLNV